MDGNRRFASDHGLLIQAGHERGKDKLEELLNWCLEVQVKILTVYALSTENFRRPESELKDLMVLFARSFREIATDERVHRHHIRVRAIGNRDVLPQEVRDAIDLAESATREYTADYYNVAIAYGGREEIVEAIRKIAREVEAGRAATGPDRLGRCLRSPLHREPPRPGPRLPDERRGADLQLPPLAVRLRRALLRRRDVARAQQGRFPQSDPGVPAPAATVRDLGARVPAGRPQVDPVRVVSGNDGGALLGGRPRWTSTRPATIRTIPPISYELTVSPKIAKPTSTPASGPT